MRPIPVGSVVDYHGSRTHGLYVVIEHHAITPELFRRGEDELETLLEENDMTLAEAYSDGVAYVIWKQGVLRKFGNRMYMISRVRRESLTETGEHERITD